MNVERLNDIALECDYWRAALADLEALGHAIPRCGDHAVNASMACIPLAMLADAAAYPAISTTADAMTAILAELKGMQATLGNLIELAGGRALVLAELIERERAQ